MNKQESSLKEVTKNPGNSNDAIQNSKKQHQTDEHLSNLNWIKNLIKAIPELRSTERNLIAVKVNRAATLEL